MFRKNLLMSCIALAGLPGYFYVSHRAEIRTDSYAGISEWSPTPAAVRQQLAALPPPVSETQRRETFADLFKKRYRTHDPAVAVGLKFTEDGHLKLMCPTRLEPYHVDAIAFSAWKEAQTLFGVSYPVDIYETFIGSRPRLFGNLREKADQPGVVRITYTYPKRAPTL